ncbi:hypothetical protein TSUD_167730, partial [Trifolium subterraneum]
LDGDHFVFPGGGTSFPDGVQGYVHDLKSLLPVNLESGSIRTVLDVGCGVSSTNTDTNTSHDTDMCWFRVSVRHQHLFDLKYGLYLREIDRLLRPGGFWVLSGPPINWRVNHEAWQTEATVLEKEQNSLEELAMQMCWEKVAEGGQIAIWQKPINHIKCMQKLNTLSSPKFCSSSDPDAGWYTKMTACIFPLPEVKNVDEISGGILKRWPMRLNASPPRLKNENDIDGSKLQKIYNDDSRTWKKRVSYYEAMLKSFSSGRYRNVMDMNAGYGGFAAAMVKYPVWVMNVVPFDAKSNNLGVIYERGLIGTYMDWCEPFSTYPRTYDLIHASGIFSMYMNKCDITDIVLEMHRILRPGGTVIIRDYRDVILKVKEITDGIRWEEGILEVASDENGSSHQEIIMVFNNTKY